MKFQKTSHNLAEVLKVSIEIATQYGFKIVTDDFLFASLLKVKDSAAVRTLTDLDIDIDQTILKLETLFEDRKKTEFVFEPIDQIENLPREATVADMYKKIIENGYKIAINMSAPYVGTEHLLYSWFELTESEIKNDLIEKGIDHNILFSTIKNNVKYPIFTDERSGLERTSILRMIGKNLTEIAQSGQLDKVVGRNKEMERMQSILMRRTKNNPILLGDSGVGKTAVVEGLAQRIVSGQVPFVFKNKVIWQIDSTMLFAGSAMRGDLENKLLSLIDEVSSDPNIILFIDEIHTILNSSQASSGGSDIGSILKPVLAKGQLRCIGATTYSEYVKYIESDPALARRFQPVYIEEIDPESAKQIIINIKPVLEKYHHVKISPEVVNEAVDLSERYITDRLLPDKALDLLDEASAKLSIENSSSQENSINVVNDLAKEQERLITVDKISAAAKVRQTKRELEKMIGEVSNSLKNYNTLKTSDLKNVVSQWTGIPINSLTSDEFKKIKQIAKLLGEKVVGQENAVKLVSSALQIAKIGLGDINRPMASFLFAGPTGVGKTELAKQIAQNLFGDKENIVQLDMSEFMESHSVSKLIGSPPGYIGFDMGGLLTEKIRKRPYSVVLFDEIEKAHPDVLNILLQVMEEGKLTDSKGRVANFKNTIIVMTTNIGAEEISQNDVLGLRINAVTDEAKEKAYDEIEKSVIGKLKKYLLPEFINRIDNIVVFRSLDKKDMKKIAAIHLDELAKRIYKYKKINISFSDKIINYIADEGFDEEYGARNIKRKIKEKIESEISSYIIANSRKNIKELSVDKQKNEVQVS